MWVGVQPMGVDMLFDIPKERSEELKSNTEAKGSTYRVIDGVIKARSASIWFTNLDHNKRHEELILYKTYNPEDYPKYDNYNAINVNKVADIPCDYNGVMGVPITFLDKYNPEQFEIVGCTESEGKGFSNGIFNSQSPVTQPLVGGKCYKRIFIRVASAGVRILP